MTFMPQFLTSEAIRSSPQHTSNHIPDDRRRKEETISTQQTEASVGARRAVSEHFTEVRHLHGRHPLCMDLRRAALPSTTSHHRRARQILPCTPKCALYQVPRFSTLLRRRSRSQEMDSLGRLPITRVSFMRHHGRPRPQSVKYLRVCWGLL
jgi:hypothetical protein